MQETVLAKLEQIQDGGDKPIWMSGKQITELLPKENPSSVRQALLLLHDRGVVVRERRKGRGKRGKTGQSSWYSLTMELAVIEDTKEQLRTEFEQVKKFQKGKGKEKKRVDSP